MSNTEWKNTPTWTATVEEDAETGELVLQFPPDMLSQLGWDNGDTLVWSDNHDGSFTLTKGEDPLPSTEPT